MTEQKLCTQCKTEKKLEDFYKLLSRKDGRTSWCKQCCSIKACIHQKKYRAQATLNNRKYKKSNIEEVRSKNREYKRTHPEQTRIRKRFDQANRKAIELIYKNCPKNMQVDHIIPIRSQIVCGLHVSWNLQYLTPFENLSKGNRLRKT